MQMCIAGTHGQSTHGRTRFQAVRFSYGSPGGTREALSQVVKLAVADSWGTSVQEFLGAEATGRGWWWCLDAFQRKYLEHGTRVVGMGPGKECVRNVSKAKSMC